MHIGLVDLKWDGHHTPYVVHLSQHFIEQGHHVTFLTNQQNPRVEELPDSESLDIRGIHVPTFAEDSPENIVDSIREQRVRIRQLKNVFEAARHSGVDIIHLLYFDRTQIPLRLATLGTDFDVPLVATLHRDAFVSTAGGNVPKRLTQFATTLALDSALDSGALDVLTVHADSIRDRIIGAVDSATRLNTRTIPAPTPESDVDEDPSVLREHLDLPQDKELLLFFGGLRHEKGPDVLAELIRDLDRPLTVVYAGSAVDFTERDVERWKQRLGDSVEIIDRLEFIPEEDVDSYFAAADALVLPYRRTRGISGPLRRAAMVGTPIFGRANSDVGDVIERHGLGATFELDDRDSFARALSRVLDGDAGDGDRLRTFAATRHWTETGNVLVDIYEELLKPER